MEAALELARQTGVLLRREALALDVSDRDLTFAVRHGLLRRMRHGMYTLPELWDNQYDDARHSLLCEAVHRRFGPRIAFTHSSALVLQGVAVWGLDLASVHVTRLDGGIGRTEHGIVHHRGRLPDQDLVEVQGKLVAMPTRAVMEHICLTGVEAGIVAADSALHQGLVTPDSLKERFEVMRHWPNRQSGHLVLRMADGRAESPGESRGRYFCFRHHLPAPDLQYSVKDADGNFIGRSDFVWHPDELLGEFDGRQKYGRLLKPGQKIEEVVAAEKDREDKMREVTGYQMLRWTWSEYSTPHALLGRFNQRLRGRAA